MLSRSRLLKVIVNVGLQTMHTGHQPCLVLIPENLYSLSSFSHSSHLTVHC
ncbi:hypothetical protein Fmac_010154 [Flemingia macrophylla]|uniref:Uncharacterized protein n=1 Tax=Flemingia macrophylla TaxID=520843 RepID=A0ABD1N288_9FABA